MLFERILKPGIEQRLTSPRLELDGKLTQFSAPVQARCAARRTQCASDEKRAPRARKTTRCSGPRGALGACIGRVCARAPAVRAAGTADCASRTSAHRTGRSAGVAESATAGRPRVVRALADPPLPRLAGSPAASFGPV